MRSHFSAFLRILSNVNTRARVIYATYFRNATYMQHICRIYAAYFSAYFAKFRIFFPHILHQNGPLYFKKNFRYKPVSLTRVTGARVHKLTRVRPSPAPDAVARWSDSQSLIFYLYHGRFVEPQPCSTWFFHDVKVKVAILL